MARIPGHTSLILRSDVRFRKTKYNLLSGKEKHKEIFVFINHKVFAVDRLVNLITQFRFRYTKQLIQELFTNKSPTDLSSEKSF